MAYRKNSRISRILDCRHLLSNFLALALTMSMSMSISIITIGFAAASLAQEVTLPPPRLASDRHSDARIAKAIEDVSADRIRQTIDKLVSFGTRSTISAQDAESIKGGRGIGAAREWIKAEFES